MGFFDLNSEDTIITKTPKLKKKVVADKRPGKFRAMADKQQKQIDDKRQPMTQNPTPKRMCQYNSRLIDADDIERGQRALRAIADAIENDTLPTKLDGLKTKAEIVLLVRKGLDSNGGYYDAFPSMDYKDTSSKGVALQRLIEGEKRIGLSQEQKIAHLEAEVQFQKIPGFFPTPAAVVSDMVEAADIEPGMIVLEPSAGKGDIADAIKAAHPNTIINVVEINWRLVKLLEAKGHNVIQGDFLETKTQADRIVMNPPFENGQDIDHVRHAYELLTPSGRLVAVMSEGSFYRSDKKATAFCEWLDDLGGVSEKLPEGVFKGPGVFRQTGIAARMVVLDKPETN